MHSLPLLVSFSALLPLISCLPEPKAQITARAIASDGHVFLSPSQSALLAADYGAWTATVGANNPSPSSPSSPSSAAIYAAPLAINDTAPSASTIYTHFGVGCVGCITWLKTDLCPQTAQFACAQLATSATGKGPVDQWVWSGEDTVSNHIGCTMAYWMPKALVQGPGSAGNGLVPTVEECLTNIFGEMSKVPIAGSINVQTPPDEKSGGGTGVAVDAGKISFLLAPHRWDDGSGYFSG